MKNVLIIGCGRILRKHLDAISSLDQELINICGFVDTDITKAAEAAAPYSVPYFSCFRRAIAILLPDIVTVLTPSGQHFDVADFSLKNGIPTLVEKPMCLSWSQATGLVETSKATNAQLYVVKQNRYNDAIQRAKKIVDDGGIGNLLYATVRVRWCRPQEYYDLASWRGTWLQDGGVISNQASHHIDLLQWFCGEPEHVFAKSNQYKANIETEDTLFSIISFCNNRIGTLEATTAISPENLEGSLSLIGTKGVIEVGGHAVNEITKFATTETEYLGFLNVGEMNAIDAHDVYGSGHRSVYIELLKDLGGQQKSAVKGCEGLKSLKLIHGMYRSIELKQEISFSEDFASIKLGNENAD